MIKIDKTLSVSSDEQTRDGHNRESSRKDRRQRRAKLPDAGARNGTASEWVVEGRRAWLEAAFGASVDSEVKFFVCFFAWKS